jgi:short-chain Z-isoprenyl diphosphate synthase
MGSIETCAGSDVEGKEATVPSLRSLAYELYERRLRRNLPPDRIPHHIGVMCDGNRRWARKSGEDVEDGYIAGGEKIPQFLGWCQDLGVGVVTLWLLSTDNFGRPEGEVKPILDVITDLVSTLADTGEWRLRPMGALDMLPDATSRALKEAADRTASIDGMQVNVAVAYGGRRELTDAMRSVLLEYASRGTSIEELADILDVEHIAEHLYTRGQPDPDLVIRTSGEQRLSGFLLWQTAHSEYYFCEALWPDFRHIDFLRAIRSYAERERRFGA